MRILIIACGLGLGLLAPARALAQESGTNFQDSGTNFQDSGTNFEGSGTNFEGTSGWATGSYSNPVPLVVQKQLAAQQAALEELREQVGSLAAQTSTLEQQVQTLAEQI